MMKYFLLKHHFPNKVYNFPVHNFGDHNRRFRNKWLDEYNGLVYSAKVEGGYCKFCASPGIRCTCGAATKELKKAAEKLREHFGFKGRKYHQIAAEKALAFCAVQEN